MKDVDSEEDKLVAAARAGDPDAFGKLIMCHADMVFRATHRITRHREDAEDAVQESIVNAFVHLASFTGTSRFSTWLTRIAINAALMRLRKKRLSREEPIEEPNGKASLPVLGEAIDTTLNPEELYAKHEHDSIVREAVRKLRPSLRKAVEVNGLEENTIQKTAQILGISTGAVKARLFYARTELRSEPGLRAVFGRNRAVIAPRGLERNGGGNQSRAGGESSGRDEGGQRRQVRNNGARIWQSCQSGQTARACRRIGDQSY
jgi:RNA polymerase sigma-70 factor (ECF subfamily)